MQITETGYYETRDGGLAYVAGILPKNIADGLPICGVVKGNDGTWNEESWTIYGLCLQDEESDTDLIRYIGKELPEEKPRPERVELSKLWICWEQWAENWIISDPKWASLKAAQDYARGYNTANYGRIKAITTADATSFVIGENL